VKKAAKREGVFCSIVGCPKSGHGFKPQALLNHMRSKHRKHPKALFKAKEIGVYLALQEADIEFEYKKHIRFWRRAENGERGTWADFAITTDWGILLLQIDERGHAHEPVQLDIIRDYNSWIGFRGKEVAILRYNPDEFHIDGQLFQVNIEERHRRLVEVLRTWTAKGWAPDKPFNRLFMYYDGESGSKLPLVAKDWENDAFRAISSAVSIPPGVVYRPDRP